MGNEGHLYSIRIGVYKECDIHNWRTMENSWGEIPNKIPLSINENYDEPYYILKGIKRFILKGPNLYKFRNDCITKEDELFNFFTKECREVRTDTSMIYVGYCEEVPKKKPCNDKCSWLYINSLDKCGILCDGEYCERHKGKIVPKACLNCGKGNRSKYNLCVDCAKKVNDSLGMRGYRWQNIDADDYRSSFKEKAEELFDIVLGLDVLL